MPNRKGSFEVSHPVNHGFTVLGDPPNFGAMKLAREALDKVRKTLPEDLEQELEQVVLDYEDE